MVWPDPDEPPPRPHHKRRLALIVRIQGRVRRHHGHRWRKKIYVLKPGEKLPTEAIIMRNFAVSRTVVREALSRLQASHMVITKHGIGTFVAEQITKSNFSITAKVPNHL